MISRNTPTVAVAHALASAEQTGATVTVHVDGHAPEIGTVKAHPTLPYGYWRLEPIIGRRALSFHTSDVTEVIFE
ncbi:hypothetical protein PQE12_gp49 [Arthrobacter phage Adumb2043]|uniref:RNA binding protein n=1 Tax=Arthrobacter phage Adumb2043 TaxID=2776851 RepID=A0A7M1CP33_9CAUD|nr:hypothetical protein PQE12_gp49 [Arthrobacter phage Adumb2043]QOP65109.1 RNA binding protein [Arthrobacter phage Adumb2043]